MASEVEAADRNEEEGPIDFYTFSGLDTMSLENITLLYWFTAVEKFGPGIQEFFSKTIEYYRIRSMEEKGIDVTEDFPLLDEECNPPSTPSAFGRPQTPDQIPFVNGRNNDEISSPTYGAENTGDYDPSYSLTRSHRRASSPDNSPLSPSYPPAGYGPSSPTDSPASPLPEYDRRQSFRSSVSSPAVSLIIDEDYVSPQTPMASVPPSSSRAPDVVSDDDDVMVIDEPTEKRPRSESSASSPHSQHNSSTDETRTSTASDEDPLVSEEIRRKKAEQDARFMQLREKILMNQMQAGSSQASHLSDHSVLPAQHSPMTITSTHDPSLPPNAVVHVYSQDSWLTPSEATTVPSLPPLPPPWFPPPPMMQPPFAPPFPGPPFGSRCAFCYLPHPPECCHIFDTFEKRTARLKDLRLCWHCLEEYNPRRCNAEVHKRRCQKCNRHWSHVAMCKN